MIKSVQKATRLLSILSESYESPVSLKELSEKADINKSTCSHIISTLESEGYVVKISHSKGYILGPAAYCLSRYGRYNNELISICQPIMQYLYKNLGYTVVLSVIEGDTKYIIDCIDDGTVFRKRAEIRKDEIYRTATGRAILCNLSKENIYQVYKKYGAPKKEDWDGITSFEELYAATKNLRKSNYYKTRVLNPNGKKVHMGYGVPIYSNVGCIGAIGVAVNLSINEEKSFGDEDKIIKLLERGANEIKRRISQNKALN
jgi:IclR family acetate operon transcriptional repressor